MSSLSVRLPDSLHDKVRELARRDGVSINQFIATAVAEKASALLTVHYLEQPARRAEPNLLARLLSRVPDVPPLPGDAFAVRGAASSVPEPAEAPAGKRHAAAQSVKPLKNVEGSGMKTEDSIPGENLGKVERRAEPELQSRSELDSVAMRKCMARRTPDEITEAMNRVRDRVGTEPDEFLAVVARRVLERVEW